MKIECDVYPETDWVEINPNSAPSRVTVSVYEHMIGEEVAVDLSYENVLLLAKQLLDSIGVTVVEEYQS